jgi:hypothetical protein
MDRNTLHAGLALLVAGCALALPSAARAEETKVLYKCVDAKGVVSIQAKSCPSGSTTAWRRDAQTEPKQTASQAAEARNRDAQNQQQVIQLTDEVNRKLKGDLPPPATGPQPGSHLAGATNPPEGSQMAPRTPAPAPDPTSLSIDGCQSAQSFATAVREKTWLGLNDDQTRRLYAWVADQCRVNTSTSSSGD